jgi:hypothetical protein
MSNILIVGAGQLGSRYLQGLCRTTNTHNIYVVDPAQKSLDVAFTRYEEACTHGKLHQLYLSNDYSLVPDILDLTIVATSSFPRAELINKLSESRLVKYWLIEKVLAPSVDDLDIIDSSVYGSEGGWVNHWMRTTEWYNNLKSLIQNSSSQFVKMHVSGKNWGLACNATHYLDLLTSVSNCSLSHVFTDELDPHWFESKRPGYFEVYGSLKGLCGERASFQFDCLPGSPSSIVMNLTWSNYVFEIEFTINNLIKVRFLNQKEKVYQLPYQSGDLTSNTADRILAFGECLLTPIKDSVALHRVLLQSLLDHWNSNNDSHSFRLPIT